MANFADYLRLAVLLDGGYQAQVTSITANGVSGAQAVELLEGLAGKTPGPKRVNVNMSVAVPTGGLEFDGWSACSNGTYHTLQIPVGAKSIIGNCWVDTCDLSGSTGANTEFSMSFVMEFNELQ